MNSNMLLLIVLIVNIRVVSNFLTGQFRSNFPWLRMHSRPPKLDYAEDLYSVLEVQPNASAVELKKAYYKMVFKVCQTIGYVRFTLCCSTGDVPFTSPLVSPGQ